MLDIKPVIGIKKGQLVPLAKHRGHEATLSSLAQLELEIPVAVDGIRVAEVGPIPPMPDRAVLP